MPSPARQSPVLPLCRVSELQHAVSLWTLDLLSRPRETSTPLPQRQTTSVAPSASHFLRLFLSGSLLPSPAALPSPRPDRTHRAPRCAPPVPTAGTDTKRAQPRPGQPPAPEWEYGLVHDDSPGAPTAALQPQPGGGGAVAGRRRPGVVVPERMPRSGS